MLVAASIPASDKFEGLVKDALRRARPRACKETLHLWSFDCSNVSRPMLDYGHLKLCDKSNLRLPISSLYRVVLARKHGYITAMRNAVVSKCRNGLFKRLVSVAKKSCSLVSMHIHGYLLESCVALSSNVEQNSQGSTCVQSAASGSLTELTTEYAM